MYTHHRKKCDSWSRPIRIMGPILLGLAGALPTLLGTEPSGEPKSNAPADTTGKSDQRISLEVRHLRYTYLPHQLQDRFYFYGPLVTDVRDNNGYMNPWILTVGIAENWDVRLSHAALTLHGSTYDIAQGGSAYRGSHTPLDREDSELMLERRYKMSDDTDLRLSFGMRRIRTEQDYADLSYSFHEILPTRGPTVAAAFNGRLTDRFRFGLRAAVFYLRGPYRYEKAYTYCCPSGMYKESAAPGSLALRVGQQLDVDLGWQMRPGATLLLGFSQTHLWFGAKHFSFVTIPYYPLYYGGPTTAWTGDRLKGFFIGVRLEL